MSNAASISAAKRRRAGAPPTNQAPGGASRQNNRVKGPPNVSEEQERQVQLSPLQILSMHQNRIDVLENMHNNMAVALNMFPNPNTDKVVTMKELDQFKNDFKELSNSQRDNKITVQQVTQKELDDLTISLEKKLEVRSSHSEDTEKSYDEMKNKVLDLEKMVATLQETVSKLQADLVEVKTNDDSVEKVEKVEKVGKGGKNKYIRISNI